MITMMMMISRCAFHVAGFTERLRHELKQIQNYFFLSAAAPSASSASSLLELSLSEKLHCPCTGVAWFDRLRKPAEIHESANEIRPTHQRKSEEGRNDNLWLQHLVAFFVSSISKEQHVFPAKLSDLLPGLGNLYTRLTLVSSASLPGRLELVSQTFHGGSVPFLGRDESLVISKANLQHLHSFAPPFAPGFSYHYQGSIPLLGRGRKAPQLHDQLLAHRTKSLTLAAEQEGRKRQSQTSHLPIPLSRHTNSTYHRKHTKRGNVLLLLFIFQCITTTFHFLV
eukprot:GHVT01050426.1.p1 GENE.GHVT01050426.1~~GHVT01050426.1.p1  ORF type:complete len:282 (+),score=31.58 GHVT01050426.1:1212-2057(+)